MDAQETGTKDTNELERLLEKLKKLSPEDLAKVDVFLRTFQVPAEDAEAFEAYQTLLFEQLCFRLLGRVMYGKW